VLDNCEHVTDAVAAIAGALLKAAPLLCLLATSREPLRAEGEWQHRLASLAIPPDGVDLAWVRGLRAHAAAGATGNSLNSLCFGIGRLPKHSKSLDTRLFQ
jgi:predicted ATPase